MMNSPKMNVETPSTSKESYLNENQNDLSPITDLAYNMKSLKTTSVGTPSRRISWSDPFKCVSSTLCSSDYSPSVDSPMLEEILMKNTKKSKSAKSKNIFCVKNEEDKENIRPFANLEDIESPENGKETEILSQDSGYGSTSGKYVYRSFSISEKRFSSMGSTPRIKVKSSLFSNTSNKDLDDYFPMEDDVEMCPVSESSMQSLFTKPLCNIENSFNLCKRKGKLPIRRCLTLEMENTSGSSSMILDSFSQDSIAQDQSNTDTVDSEPLKRLSYKRPDASTVFPWQSKRRKSSPCVNSSDDIVHMRDFLKQRSFSETAATIMEAVQQADLQPELIGDCSRCYALPLIRGRHQDLKCISPDTLVQVMKGEYREKVDSFTVVDCRYPYEFEGGHIQGAQNIFTKEEIMQKFLENAPDASERNIIIFHCEFSSERAPNLCRFLRNKDRELNECNYPKLHHPEIYILEGGYKAFFASFREYCEPQEYKPMNHKDHSSELRLFRAKSKSWGADTKNRYKMKSSVDNAGNF